MAMRPHLEAHRSGALQGALPARWLERRKLVPCRVCNELVVGGPGHVHPRCRPAARAAAPASPGAPAGDSRDRSQHDSPTSLDDGFRMHTRTLKHVPKSCRKLWSQAVTRAIAAVLLYNVAPGVDAAPAALKRCEDAWADFLLLPRYTLQAPTRAGKKHKHMIDSKVRNCLQRWLAGERQAPSGGRAVQSRAAAGSAAVRRRRCAGLVEEGLDGQACRALTSGGIAPSSRSVLAALKAKHPPGPAVQPVDPRVLAVVDELSTQDVLEALRSFPNGSAGGASGWRPQHFVDAVAAPHQLAALSALTDLVNLLARGQAPQSLSPYLAGASLIALAKDDDDLRPIAVGEPLRRLVSKALCKEVKEEARALFWPLQIGVASPLGCEAGVHVVGQYAERHRQSTTKVIFAADFSNVFNTVDRNAFLAACDAAFPRLSAWSRWCYGIPAHLFFSDYSLQSSGGVQ